MDIGIPHFPCHNSNLYIDTDIDNRDPIGHFDMLKIK